MLENLINMEKNKIILITGGAGRVGQRLAEDLIKNGNKVLLGDLNKSKLVNLKKKINSTNLEIFAADLTTKKNIDRFINFAFKKFNNIHAAVHCSYPTSKGWGTKLENLKENYLNDDLKKQLGGSIIFSQRILKHFVRQKEGNLIFISSIQGVQAPKFDHYKNLKMTSPIEYSAIKSGIISVTKYLSKYFKNKNIRVNCVSPGGIDDNQPQIFKTRYKSSCNSKGLLNSKDISKAIIFLLSNNSKYINGQNLIIDDGWSL